MTDDNSSDQQPVHEEVPEQDHQPQGAEAGVWSDDHPPVDDFSDAGSANEETASVSHEVTGEGDETVAQTDAPSRSMLPLFAGIGGILLLGAVIYWQFGHSSSPPMMTMPAAAPKSSSSMAGTNQRMPETAPTTKKVEESDIASLYKPPAEGAPTTPSEAASTAPTTSMATTPEPALPPPAMPATAPIPAPPAAVPPVPDTRIDAIGSRIESLEKLVQADTQQLSQLNNIVVANQAMPPAANQVSPALEDRLNKIEQTLMQIEHKSEARAPAVTMPAETGNSSVASSEVVRPVSHHTHAVTKHKHVTKKSKTTTRRIAPMEPMSMASSSSSSWFLRAATPNEAWVSADPHSAELRHVQVGDSLPGIGQIRSIRQTPAGWEIDGATGTVR